MAVAVKNTPETTPHRLFDRLAADSLLGALYVVLSILVVFTGIPTLWQMAFGWGAVDFDHGSPVSWAFLILLMVLAAGGSVWLGARLLGANPPHGTRAGIFTALVGLLVVFLLTCMAGSWIEPWVGADQRVLGIAGTIVLGVALLAGLGYLFLNAKFQARLGQFEDQGWFNLAPYKRSQGQKVRRGTIVGILALAACGIITLWNHGTLKGEPKSWTVLLPFTDGVRWPLLLAVSITVPVLLAVLSFWLAYRAVNYPTFADFLIATEAELNKVSWTTRKRLIQDTIVVLVTVVLLTLFLFVVDQVWAQVLTRIGILQTPTEQNIQSNKEIPW